MLCMIYLLEYFIVYIIILYGLFNYKYIKLNLYDDINMLLSKTKVNFVKVFFNI